MKQPNLLRFLLLFAILVPAVAFAGTSGPSPIPPAPTFQIGTNVTILCRGVINNIPITIKNSNVALGSAPMKEVQLGIANTKSLLTVGNGTVNTDTINPNSSLKINMPVFVSLNASSFITAGVSVNFNYFTFYSDSEVRNISFGTETCASPLSISVSPKIITSGHIGNITVNLTNTGITTLKSISLHLSLPSIDGQILSTQPVYVSSIDPAKSVLISEGIFVSRNASQVFPINVTANLYNGTSPVQISASPILLSSGIINISASSITLSPLKPLPGGIFSISFVLTDTGTTGVSALTVTTLPIKGFTAFGSNSVFVGDMQVDSQTPATITLTADKTLKSGTYTIPIRINYLNNLRENLSTTIEVPVSLGAALLNSTTLPYARTNRSPSGGLLIIILVVLVAVFAFLYFRERRRKPKS